MNRPELAGVVVAWRAAADVATLAAAWPRDERYELVVVDQSGDLPEMRGVVVVRPGRNLGFAAGCNLGARTARADRLLFLNPDAVPEPGAVETLASAFARSETAAGVVPRLVGFDGASQSDWQLRRLPSRWALLAHAFFLAPGKAFAEPAEGAAIEQPAAAALGLRRERFEAIGGFDEGFFPAWWEDVDLARRLADAGDRLLYFPDATFRHRLGSTVGELGYGAFLLAYDRNLARYLAKHHGRGWSAAFRALRVVGTLARLALVPFVRPRRAATRRDAATALFGAARGAALGWPGARVDGAFASS